MPPHQQRVSLTEDGRAGASNTAEDVLLHPATKVFWTLDHIDGVSLSCNIDTWLLWKLTDGISHASRTSLLIVELLPIFRVLRCMLPDVRSSASTFCEVNLGGHARTVPVSCMVGDQHAALYAHGYVSPGHLRHRLLPVGTYGQSQSRLPRRPAHYCCLRLRRKSIVGAAIQWLAEGLGILKTASESEALSVDDTGGVYIVPAFADLTVLESIALQTYDSRFSLHPRAAGDSASHAKYDYSRSRHDCSVARGPPRIPPLGGRDSRF
ncbi:MAG: uncharacterized protein KVP18_004897 [Porospora cf. gigantea A]|uniref:uncharacterized protein n=1 Tax=Porospora cf. gigantea A TaxID=2853593 RepID=UPI003559646A|nr:MAG: hypothetical protein KVP18_004897 [Porospora cf. gigantea A]